MAGLVNFNFFSTKEANFYTMITSDFATTDDFFSTGAKIRVRFSALAGTAVPIVIT